MKKNSWIAISVISSLIVSVLVVTFSYSYFIPKYGFVRNQKLYDEFNGKKELQQKLIQTQEKQAYILDSLKAEMGLISDEDLLQKKQRFYINLESEFQLASQQQNNEYIRLIWQQINDYTQAYGKEKGYDCIIGANGNGGIMYLGSTYDLTEEVIEFINNKYEGN